jgi:hypothetical protein
VGEGQWGQGGRGKGLTQCAVQCEADRLPHNLATPLFNGILEDCIHSSGQCRRFCRSLIWLGISVMWKVIPWYACSCLECADAAGIVLKNKGIPSA